MKKADVGIVGGGLAGLACAIQLADRGHRVVLFEKNQYPFHRVCGEYISMESWNFLESLGLPLSQFGLPMIQNFKLTSPSRQMQVKLPLGGFGISRYKLDAELAQLAKKKGVRLLEGVKVNGVDYDPFADLFSLRSTQDDFQLRAVIGAQGKRSNLDKEMKRKFIASPKPPSHNYVGIKYHVQADLPDNRIELHLFKNGYCGISKVEGNRYCLCYLTLANNLSEHGGNIEQMEQQILAQNPSLKHYITNFTRLYDQPLTISQIEFGRKELIKDHVLFGGDAAGMITPLTGNGMSIALHSAKMLAHEVGLFLEGGSTRDDMEINYNIHWKNTFARRIWVGRTFHKMFYNLNSVNAAIAILGKVPFVAKKLIALTHGQPF